MRLLRGSSTAFAVLSAVLATLFFSLTAYADDSSSAALPNLSTITDKQSQSSTPTATTVSSQSNTATSTTASSPKSTSGSASSSAGTVSITGSGIGASTIQIVPTITGGPSATDQPNVTDPPRVGGQFSYPTASVPPTQNAPYMQASKLPEGTVFIAVGAGLGFMAVCVLLWRGLTVWFLHRSVKRAARNQELADAKTMFNLPIAQNFKYSDRASTHSMSNLAMGNSGKRGRPSTAGHVPVPSQSLFYSPTAGVTGVGGLSHAGNRGSNYLPAGYYAAVASAPGNGAGMTHIGSASRESINLANLRPNSQGYTRPPALGLTPPDSPRFYPMPMGQEPNPSTSTLDLNQRTTAPRAPSAYLEDLFDEAGLAPGQPLHPHTGRY